MVSGVHDPGDVRNRSAILFVAIGISLCGCAEPPGKGADPTSDEIGNAVTGAEDRAGRNQADPGRR